MAGPSPLRIRLLGGLTVEGVDERTVGSRKGRTLLKALALARGAPVAPDALADILWRDEQPSRPADQLAVLVSRLRSVVGAERLTRTDAGYSLHCDWLDLAELEERVVEAERRRAAGQPAAARAAAEAALALVRGPLLPDEDGEWVDAERAAAGRLAHRARLGLATAALEAGDLAAAVDAGEAALDADPYDEAALRVVMRAHAGAGRPASALAAYVRVREQLAEELGVSPTPETEALHDEVVLGEHRPPSETRPAPAPVGREQELATLADALGVAAAGEPAHVVIEGEPGIGKSTLLSAATVLARHRGFLVAHGAADALGRDLPLQPVLDAARSAGADLSAIDPAGAALQVGRDGAPTVLGDATAGRLALFADLLGALEDVAGDRPMLVALDDVHLADAATLEWVAFAVRRGRRLAAIVARRSGATPLAAPSRLLRLGPLDEEAAAAIVGRDRAADLHARTGGNPLFLVELARSGGALPATVRDAIAARAESLGADAAATIRIAAALGPDVDLDLLAHVLERSVRDLLDHADAAAAAGLLSERGTTYRFTHDLAREALAATVTTARRAFVHREAARALVARPDADPQEVAWHARQGGDAALAAAALVGAAERAAARYDHDAAEAALADAIALADGPHVRLARARLRMARWDLDAAAEDAAEARARGAGAAAFEVAGWIEYYRRDAAAAERFADEGAARAEDEGVRASCLALAGRARHARGAVDDAEPRLVEAAQCRVAAVRAVAQVWLAGLRAHRGDGDEARDLAERALLEPDRFAHPFGRFHGQFVRGLALGMQGRADDVVRASASLEAEAARAGTQGARFVPVALNLRSWVLRGTGRLDEAIEVLRRAQELCPPDVPAVAEPRHAGMLDIAETSLDAAALDEAARTLDAAAASLETWRGSMAWRARQRLAVLRARLSLEAGDATVAEELATRAAEEAGRAGNARHELLAACIAAEAAAVDGRAREVDVAAVDEVLRRLDRCAGLEVWHHTARLAAAYGVDRWHADAERRAARFVAAAGPRRDDASSYVQRRLDALTRRPR